MQVGAGQSRLTVLGLVTAGSSNWCTTGQAYQSDRSCARIAPPNPSNRSGKAIGLQDENDECRQSRVIRLLRDRVEGGGSVGAVISYLVV